MPTDPRALIDRLLNEFWNGKQLDLADQLFAPGFTAHNAAFPEASGGPVGPGPFVEAVRAILAAFPDLTFHCEDLVSEGDRVAFRWSAVGTHRGEYDGIPATGRRIYYAGITFARVMGGQLAEAWVCDNWAAVLAELRAAGAE